MTQSELSLSTAPLARLTADYLQAATSQNTRRAYQQDIRHFVSSGALLPASSESILHYLHAYAGSLNPRTLKRRLTALRHWHTSQGFLDPTAHPLIRKTLSGITRLTGTPAEKAAPLTLDQLYQMSHWLTQQSALSAIRDNALLQIGFFGAFRRSELVAICWEHLYFVPEGVTILIPRSKTDQEGEGQSCAIPYGSLPVCPVTALKQWQQISGIETGAVFRAISKGGKIANKALSGASITPILQSLARECGLMHPENYSGHSLRRGFATAASQKGVTLRAIMRQGRWRHEGTVQGYIEEGQQFQANAADVLLQSLIQPTIWPTLVDVSRGTFKEEENKKPIDGEK